MWPNFDLSRTRTQPIFHILASALLLLMACGGGDSKPPDANLEPDAPPPAGTLSLNWQITDGTGPLACAQIAGSSVTIRATPSDGGSGVPSVLSCDSGGGTVSLPPGTFDVVVSLITSNNSQLAQVPQFDDVEIVDGLETALGALTFEVVPQGNVEFTIATNSGSSNCAPVASGGAGMTDIYMEFKNELGACVPSTFTIAAGASNPEGTFASDCAGTTLGACIESDQTIRVEGVPSGASSMVFTGYKDGVECFSRTSQFTVPGADLTTTLIPQQLVRELIPACDP